MATPVFTVSNEQTRPLIDIFYGAGRTAHGHTTEMQGPTFMWVDDSSPQSGNMGFTRIYFHGTLEQTLGYDVPLLLQGDVKDLPVQDALVVDPAHPHGPYIPAVIVKAKGFAHSGWYYIFKAGDEKGYVVIA